MRGVTSAQIQRTANDKSLAFIAVPEPG